MVQRAKRQKAVAPTCSCIFRPSNAPEMGSVREGQKVSYQEQRDPKRGKSSAENLKAV
jgi:hypothetical protein